MANGNKKYPSHRAYTVAERKGSSTGSWREIGAAWRHEDGFGLTIKLDAFPANGEIVLRVPAEKDASPDPGATA